MLKPRLSKTKSWCVWIANVGLGRQDRVEAVDTGIARAVLSGESTTVRLSRLPTPNCAHAQSPGPSHPAHAAFTTPTRYQQHQARQVSGASPSPIGPTAPAPYPGSNTKTLRFFRSSKDSNYCRLRELPSEENKGIWAIPDGRRMMSTFVSVLAIPGSKMKALTWLQ